MMHTSLCHCLYTCLFDCLSLTHQEENDDGELLGFNAVAAKLLGIVTAPIHSALVTKQPNVIYDCCVVIQSLFQC